LLCANLADPTPTGAARGRSPVAAAAPGLSAGHGPLRAARGRGPTVTTAPSLLAGHRPLRAAHGRDPTTVAGLRWICGPDSSTGGQRQTACS
jgi:hypothetical protein